MCAKFCNLLLLCSRDLGGGGGGGGDNVAKDRVRAHELFSTVSWNHTQPLSNGGTCWIHWIYSSSQICYAPCRCREEREYICSKEEGGKTELHDSQDAHQPLHVHPHVCRSAPWATSRSGRPPWRRGIWHLVLWVSLYPLPPYTFSKCYALSELTLRISVKIAQNVIYILALMRAVLSQIG